MGNVFQDAGFFSALSLVTEGNKTRLSSAVHNALYVTSFTALSAAVSDCLAQPGIAL